MADYSKKFKYHSKDTERGKRREFSQEFEYKRKDDKEEHNEYVQKQPKPTEAEASEPAMREAEPEGRHENPKKKRGSGFGFNSSFGQKSGKFAGQDRWANDKKGHQEDDALEEAPKDNQHDDYNTKPRYGQNKGGHRRDNLTYYERKNPSDTKTEPDYYKSTNFDLPKKESQTTGSSSVINWNTQNKRRQEAESDDYEGRGAYKEEDGYYNKPAYKRGYKNEDDRKYPAYPKKHRNQNYQDYEQEDATYKDSHYQAGDYYGDKKSYKGDRNYPERSERSGPNQKYGDRKYNDYKHQDAGQRENLPEDTKQGSNQESAPARAMGGRAFIIPNTDDLKKLETHDPKRKEGSDRPHQKQSAGEGHSKHSKNDGTERTEVTWLLISALKT